MEEIELVSAFKGLDGKLYATRAEALEAAVGLRFRRLVYQWVDNQPASFCHSHKISLTVLADTMVLFVDDMFPEMLEVLADATKWRDNE